jgi:hypothetical protein
MTPDEMEVGHKYQVLYRIKGLHYVDRLMVARFIGSAPDTFRVGTLKYDFSGRSGERHGKGSNDAHAFGTASLYAVDIKEITEVPQESKNYADRKANGKK